VKPLAKSTKISKIKNPTELGTKTVFSTSFFKVRKTPAKETSKIFEIATLLRN